MWRRTVANADPDELLPDMPEFAATARSAATFDPYMARSAEGWGAASTQSYSGQSQFDSSSNVYRPARAPQHEGEPYRIARWRALNRTDRRASTPMHSFPDRENRFNYPGDWADPDIGWSRNEMIETLADMANMPLTVETLQILCDAIYEDPEAPPTGDRYAGAKALFWDRRLQRAGWRIVVQPEMDARTGYCGVAIYHPASNTVIIVNRGTDFSKALREPREALLDIGADRDIHNGRSTDQFEYANQFLQRTKRGMRAMGIRAPIVVTGHSLGGALAQLQLGVSLVDRNFRDEDVLDVVGVTFAALGADNSVIRYLQEKSATYGYFDPSNVRTESWEKLRNYVRRGDGFTQRYEVLFDEPRTLVLGTDRLLSALDLADMKKAEDAFNNPFDDRFFGLNNTDEAILARRNAAFLTLFRLYMKNHDHRNYYSREFVVPLAEAFPAYRPGRY